MVDVSREMTRGSFLSAFWTGVLIRFPRFSLMPRPRRPARLDLLEARDDLLRDIGLFDRPDLALRRSELVLPSERPSWLALGDFDNRNLF